MRIAVIGAGAMGSIYGGHLSLHNEVYLVDTNPNVVAAINENGLKLQEYGTDNLYHPKALTSTEGLEPVDLIILFVKALFSKAALAGNKALIGPDTYVLTLQNGSGHEDILGEFVDQDHIIIGTTEDNGAVLGMGYIRHGGEGNTNVGMLVEDKNGNGSYKAAYGHDDIIMTFCQLPLLKQTPRYKDFMEEYVAFKIGNRFDDGTDANESLYNFTTNRIEELFTPPTEMVQI